MTVPSKPPIGLTTAVALVVGNMIGSGVFLLPASLAPFGGLSLVGWILSAGGSLALALVFAHLTRVTPSAGGPYAFARRAFGDLAGFLVGWSYWISMWAANAALAIALVGYLDPFIPSVVRDPPRAAALALVLLWIVTFINCLGVREAGRVQVVSTAIKILPLVVVGLAGLVVMTPAHFEVPASAGPPVAGVASVVTLTLWAFLGLESATIPAGSVREPSRTIPRATIAGTTIAAAIYVASTSGVMGVIPPETLGQTSAPFADAARILFGETAARLVALGAAISCFGALNGWTLMVGQLPLAAARDRLFPPLFGRVSSRGVPVTGMILAGVLSTALVLSNATTSLVALFTFIILLSTLGTLVPYLVCALAVVLRRPGTARAAGAIRAIGAGALLFALVAMAGAGLQVLALGALGLLAGVPVFVWSTRARAQAPA